MINRIKHFINGVEFVPTNKDTFSLSAVFPDEFGEWENSFTTSSKVVLPEEGYNELMRHLNDIGVQQMPSYNIKIDGQNNNYFVDLYQGVKIRGSLAEVTIKALEEKDNIKTSIDTLTFEYLKQNGDINDSHFVNIPYAVIPDDIGIKILGISSTIFTLTNEAINRTEKLRTRIADLIGATSSIPPSTGMIIRYSLLVLLDIAILVLLEIAIKNLVTRVFELLHPSLRSFKAMTVDTLLNVSLAKFNIQYQSSLKDEFKKLTVLPVPIDYQNKKFFQLLLNEDERILNRGYPTASDTIPTCGMLITELCKMFNIRPRIGGGILTLEPKQTSADIHATNLDLNFNSQSKKETEIVLDMSRIWNTKILSYTNDSTDKMLFDNPQGLRVEYKSVPDGVIENDLTIIKGFDDNRINFALGTIKEGTKLEEFLRKLAKVSDKLLGTSYQSQLDERLGILAISQEQFVVTKLLYQIGGRQTSNYLSKIGANSLYSNYHLIDSSKNNLSIETLETSVRMNNEKFLSIIQNNLVNLEGKEVEIIGMEYLPESSSANIDYREAKTEWSENIKSIKVYEE